MHRLEVMSIKTLTDVSDRIYEEPTHKHPNNDNDISTWGGRNSEIPYSNSPTPIPRQTPNILIKQSCKKDDPYSVIQKYETLHMKMNQDKVNQMIEKSLKNYTENKKKLDSMNNTITTKFTFPPMSEASSPRDSISTKNYLSQSPANGMSSKRRSVFAIKEELTKYLEEVVAKEKERRIKENLRRFMSDKNSEKTEYVSRSRVKDGKPKLKRKFILYENGMEELKRVNEYPKQGNNMRYTKDKYTNYVITENYTGGGNEEKFKLPPIATMNITNQSVSTRVRRVNLNLSL